MWEDFEERLDELRNLGRYRELRRYRIDGPHLECEDGRLVNFGSNDYLGFAKSQASNASKGQGATASALVCGWTDSHHQLAETIAEFEGSEAAVVFPSGFAACSGTIASLAQAGDLILSDALNHASLIDGCRLSKAERIVYPHRDVGDIDRLLATKRDAYKRIWIVTDGVFSMDGHVAPLVDLCDLADRYGATVVVDEAHGTGILGATASGVCEAMGVKDRVSIRIGTLSKAIGAQGGFVACPSVVAQYLINHCRSLIFSTALALPAVEAALRVFTDTGEMLRRRDRVCHLSRLLRERLGRALVSFESDIPIIPIAMGDDRDATLAAERLRQLGQFVPAIRPPTVPEGQSRLRVSLTADHTEAMVEHLVGSLASL